MSAALDRWLTRLYHAVGGSLFLGLCAIVSYAAGDRHRPEPVRSSERPTPEVAAGGALRRARGIADLAACTRLDIAVDAPPRDRHGRRRTVETGMPADVPCGPAMPVESPSAVCEGGRRTVRPQHRPDAVTPFRGTSGGVTTGPAGAKTGRAP